MTSSRACATLALAFLGTACVGPEQRAIEAVSDLASLRATLDEVCADAIANRVPARFAERTLEKGRSRIERDRSTVAGLAVPADLREGTDSLAAAILNDIANAIPALRARDSAALVPIRIRLAALREPLEALETRARSFAAQPAQQ
jgi:hypothetical protein